MSLVIDSHQHFWQLDKPFEYGWLYSEEHKPICRSYLPADLEPLLKQCGVDRSVFVQTQHNVEENRWVLGLAEEHDFIAGIVGWVDLASPDCQAQVEEFQDHPLFVGVRHVVQDEPDEDFIIRPDVKRGLGLLQKHGVPYDLLFFTQHLRHAVTLGREFPDLPMVVDHLAKPKIAAGLTDGWKQDLQAAASCPNIFCKLSGMVTEADWNQWKPADLKPYVEIALEAFGPERCMYGSDWPVCELAGSYQQVHAALKEVLGDISDTEADHIYAGTATRFYGLDV